MDVTPLLRHLDLQIVTAGLAMWAALGTTESGSRATAQVQINPFYLAVQAVARQIVEDRSRQTLRRFVTANFGADYKVPRLRVSKIIAKNIAQLVAAVRDLSAAGFNFTDRETQNDVRDQLDLRHLPEPLARVVDELPDDAGLEPGPQRVDPRTSPDVPREGDDLAA